MTRVSAFFQRTLLP